MAMNHIHFIDQVMDSAQGRPCYPHESNKTVTLIVNGNLLKKSITKQACWPFRESCESPACACFANLPDGVYKYFTSEIVCGTNYSGTVTVAGGETKHVLIGGLHGCPLPTPVSAESNQEGFDNGNGSGGGA